MGADQSLPHGEPLYIQEPACCSGFKWRFGFEVSQPASLSGLASNKWSEFQVAVHQNAVNIKNNELVWFACILMPIIGNAIPGYGYFISWGLFLAIIALQMYVVKQNKIYDDAIRDLCNKFSSENGVTLQYCAQYTGMCKPKHAKTTRAIVIQSPGVAIGGVVGPAVAVASSAPISVQVPPGVTSGQTLQIQTPSGLMNVVVPDGVSEGQTFQVQVPVAPTPQIVTVQATPVPVAPTPQTQVVTAQATKVAPASGAPNADEDNPNMEAPASSNSQSAPAGGSKFSEAN